MKTYEQVEEYMKTVGLKYIKNSNDFFTGLARVTMDKDYTMEVARVLNARAEGAPTDNSEFYQLKNKIFDASIYISAAFDGGVFRHIGNMVMDHSELFVGNVLDMGCDCGIVTCFMAKCYPDVSFTGVDINEKAIDNAKALAEKLEINNVSFECIDIYQMNDDVEYDTITSFRVLLDIADDYARHLPFVGKRDEREAAYENAFSKYAEVISKCLKDNGQLLTVERYTAEYGWLGWLQALSAQGINAVEGCELMRAQDISSTKEYSVTFAKKQSSDTTPIDAFNAVMAKDFKTGAGYDGGMAEFVLYYDSEGEIEFTDVLKKDRVIHQYAFATAKSGKRMFFDAAADSRKIKYYNEKKEDKMIRDYEGKIALYDPEKYSINKYTV